MSPMLICLVVLRKSRDCVPNPHLLNPWQREVGGQHEEVGVVKAQVEEIAVETETGRTSVETEVDSEAVVVHIVDSFHDNTQHDFFVETENKCDLI